MKMASGVPGAYRGRRESGESQIHSGPEISVRGCDPKVDRSGRQSQGHLRVEILGGDPLVRHLRRIPMAPQMPLEGKSQRPLL